MPENSFSMTTANLKCEYRINPVGIDNPKPGLSWEVRSEKRCDVQTAYQIIAASNQEIIKKGKGDLWDTGKVESASTIQIEYDGTNLKSGQRVWWAVKTWDKDGKESEFSAPATFDMALLTNEDWKAKWICRPEPEIKEETDFYKDRPAPLLRKSFTINKKVSSAKLYISGLGYYEAYINGKRIGDNCLDPGWTNYSKRILYSVYDITQEIKSGNNAIGTILGNGWYNPLPLRFWGSLNMRENLTTGTPRLFAQLEITFVDGSSTSIITDNTWKTNESPIIRNNIYLGEIYDARQEIENWNSPDFDDSKWDDASLTESPGGKLAAQSAPPVRITKTIKPVSKTKTKNGTWIFDMGQNFAGWIRLRAAGKEGTKIVMRFGELLHKDGTLNTMTSVCGQIKAEGTGGKGAPAVAEQSDTFILRGTGKTEEYTPRFTFHGFRYVELSGYPGEPAIDDVTGLRMNSDVEKTGNFSCSEELYNRIYEITEWTLLSNLFSVQSDCPHRERLGYGGDIVVSSGMAMLNRDMSTFYAKVVQDLSDDVRSNGGIPETAPFVGIADEGLGEKSGPVEWGTAYPLLQYMLYQYYGDKKPAILNMENTKKWMNLLESKSPGMILDSGLGDHETLVPKDRPVMGTAFFYMNATLAEKLALITQNNNEAKKYNELSNKIRSAFYEKFINKDTGAFGTGTQASQAIALDLDLIPKAQIVQAAAYLSEDVMKNNKGHLSTGIIGTRALLFALGRNNYQKTALELSLKKDFPGWGNMVENGATTLWEHWEYSDNTFSHNHPMFGSICEWLVKDVAGINPDPDADGFDKIIIRPLFTKELKWAKGEYKSVRGMIKSEWKNEENLLTLEVEIPANTTAKIYLPELNQDKITESGKVLSEIKEIKKVTVENGFCIIMAGSGKYVFNIKR